MVHAVVVEHVYRHIRPVYLHILSVLGRQRRLTQVQYDGVHLQAEKHCQRPRLGHTQPRVQCHLQPNERHFLEQQDHLVNQLKLDLQPAPGTARQPRTPRRNVLVCSLRGHIDCQEAVEIHFALDCRSTSFEAKRSQQRHT
ncbi:hypothetical protein GN958_ATG23585, partial [Phytophthora infestans]